MVENNEYTGFFAEFYDRLHESNDDINAYIQFGKKYGPRILELGSGTGRILIPLAKAGYFVTGLEFSQDMINIAAQKLNKESLTTIERCTMLNGDAANFLLDQVFDLIIAPCNFINHFPAFEQLELVLSCIKKHMTTSTVLVIDNSMPALKAWIETNGKEEVFEFDGPDQDKKIIDRFTASFDFIHQIETDHIILEEYRKDRLIRQAECRVELSYYFPRELQYLLTSNGFAIFHQQGSTTKDIPIDMKADEMVFCCRKLS